MPSARMKNCFSLRLLFEGKKNLPQVLHMASYPQTNTWKTATFQQVNSKLNPALKATTLRINLTPCSNALSAALLPLTNQPATGSSPLHGTARHSMAYASSSMLSSNTKTTCKGGAAATQIFCCYNSLQPQCPM